MVDEIQAAVVAADSATVEPTQADALVVEDTSTSAPEIDAPGEVDQPPKKPHWSTKRIDELTRERRSAERDRDYWREMAMRENAPARVQQEQKPQELKPEQFQSYEDYLDAKAEAKAKSTYEQMQRQQQQEQEARKASERESQVQQSLSQNLSKARERYADFDEVVMSQEVAITEAMTAAIAESDQAGEVAYFLGKNPAEAARIAALSPVAQAREIGRLEARIAAQTKPVAKPVATVNPVGGGAATPKKSAEDMTFAEYKAARQAGTLK